MKSSSSQLKILEDQNLLLNKKVLGLQAYIDFANTIAMEQTKKYTSSFT